jgi:hypothetical protein
VKARSTKKFVVDCRYSQLWQKEAASRNLLVLAVENGKDWDI